MVNMVAPRNRLLFWVGLLLPIGGFTAMFPAATTVCLAIIGVAAVVIIADAAVAGRALKGLRVELPDLVRLTMNREGEFPLTIHNASRKQRLIRAGLPFPREVNPLDAEMDISLPADAEFSRIPWKCAPTRRGRYFLRHCYFETQSPLGFWNARSSSAFESEFRVYPNLLEERKKMAAIFLHRGALGIHAQRMVGQGRDFEKLREYLHGDSLDQIHWKATAKRGKPVTKVFQIERTQEVYVCIDFSRLTAQEFDSRSILERFVTSALVLGLVSQQQGDLFGLLTFSDRVYTFLRARNGRAHYSACRDAIYTLQPRVVTPDFNDLFSFVRLRLRRRALLVILTDLSDPVLAEDFVQDCRLISRQHLVLVNMVKPLSARPLFSAPDVKAPDDLYAKLGGHLFWENLVHLQNTLHSYGISLSQLENERLTAEVVTQYLNIKQRQLL